MKWGFGGWSASAWSPAVNAERTIDFVPERVEGTAKSRVAMYRRPGLTSWGTAGSGPHRASLELNGRYFVISGSELYEGTSTGTFTLRGTVAFSTDPAAMVSNGTGGNQVFMVSGGLGYIYNLTTNTLTAITDPDFPANAVSAFFIKGHFGTVSQNTRTFAISAAFDGTSWDALDIGQKSTTQDALIGAVVDQYQGELWLIGNRTTEVWWYSGAASFPLEPIPNRVIPVGGAAIHSWIDVGGVIYGLAENKDGEHQVVRFRGGYTPERISTHALEQQIEEYSVLSDAHAFAMEWHGHTLYLLTFPTADITHVFDDEGAWSEWSYWNSTTAERRAFLGHGHTYVFGSQLLGSRSTGQVYALSSTTHTDAGDEIRSERIAPYYGDGVTRLRHDRLRIDAELGVGLLTGQGSAPRAMVSWGDDGGQTFAHERLVDLGSHGQYRGRAELRRLGLAGDAGRVYKVVVSDPVVVAIADVDVTAQPIGA